MLIIAKKLTEKTKYKLSKPMHLAKAESQSSASFNNILFYSDKEE